MGATPRDHSLQSSARMATLNTKRDTSRDPAASLRQRDTSPRPSTAVGADLERELEEKNAMIGELKTELRTKEMDLQAAYTRLEEEISKRGEISHSSGNPH